KPTQEGYYRHFAAVADACDIPIVLYNIPGRTASNILPETIARLAEIPTIVGVKEATGSLDQASHIASLCDLTILSGDDSLTLPLMSVGARSTRPARRASRSRCGRTGWPYERLIGLMGPIRPIRPIGRASRRLALQPREFPQFLGIQVGHGPEVQPALRPVQQVVAALRR